MCIGAISVSLIWLVRDHKPNLKAMQHDNSSEMTVLVKFKYLTSEAGKEVWERPKYIFCFICLLVSRLIAVLFSVYLQLWVMSF